MANGARRARLGSIGGVPIVMQSTTILLVLVFAMLFARNASDSGLFSRGEVLLVGGLGAILVLVSTLLHEFGHATAARLFGIRTTEVSLHVFGGLASFEASPRTPLAAFVISVSGPLVNVLIWVSLTVTGLADLTAQHVSDPVTGSLVLDYLLWLIAGWNLLIGLLNLLPALPLDGGHAVSAVLWAVLGDSERAIRAAAVVGLVAFAGAVVLLVAGIVPGTNVMLLVFLGFFVIPYSLSLLRSGESRSGRSRAVPSGGADELRDTLSRAAHYSLERGTGVVGSTEVLLAVLAYESGPVAQCLRLDHVTFDDVWRTAPPSAPPILDGRTPVSSEGARRIVSRAREGRADRVGLFLAMDDDSEAGRVLSTLGVDVSVAKASVSGVVGS